MPFSTTFQLIKLAALLAQYRLAAQGIKQAHKEVLQDGLHISKKALELVSLHFICEEYYIIIICKFECFFFFNHIWSS
jgi:hypothetical protein